jgi:hypothetical protein
MRHLLLRIDSRPETDLHRDKVEHFLGIVLILDCNTVEQDRSSLHRLETWISSAKYISHDSRQHLLFDVQRCLPSRNIELQGMRFPWATGRICRVET